MGYYENPPMIDSSGGYNQISASIVDASKSIGEALIKRGERKRLTIQKLQDQKNETDLEYSKKLSEWDIKNPNKNEELNTKLHGMIQQKIQVAADAKIALLGETDNAKRQEYLKLIRNADGFMNNAANFAKNVAMDSATWRENASAITVGSPNGWVINGRDDSEIGSRRGAIEILGGMDQMYDNHSIDIEDTGDSFRLIVKGKRKDSDEQFELPIDARSYLSSDEGGTGGFLQKVENLDEFVKTSKKNVVDEKGGLYENFLSEKFETAKLNDGYKLVYGQRLNTEDIKKELANQAQIKASGYLRADKEASLRALYDYTLEQQPGSYDRDFKGKTPMEQSDMLTTLLTEKAFNSITRKLTRTTENGKTVYWGSDSKVSEIPTVKPTKAPAAGKTPAAVIKQQDINARIKDVISTGQGGTPIKNGLTLTKDENGAWSLLDKDGMPYAPTANTHDPYILQKYIGGTLKKPLK